LVVGVYTLEVVVAVVVVVVAVVSACHVIVTCGREH
jgi:hypothetical protein